tara:strand:+ start:77507 stop:78109 length:603 start_codon:yes stop_codon:yes gene_type:complete
MITGFILGAGRSERMGTLKQLLPFGEVTVIEHTCRILTKSCLRSNVILVVGHCAKEITARISALSVRIAYNPDPGGDMLSSIQCGLAYTPHDNAILIALGDQPLVTSEIVNQLVQEYQRCPEGIVVPVYQGKQGHPIILSPAYREELLFNSYPGGLKELRDHHIDSVRHVPVDTDGVLIDMDYRHEYEAALKQWEKDSQS